MNFCAIHRHRFTLLPNAAIIQKIIASLVSQSYRNILITDDFLSSRNRSKNIELQTILHNHVNIMYVRGFCIPTLG
ncbi:hypothetical protein DW674_11020 [Mitsuokella multacida]|uniref:Uncharacterized protein n=1 Tax=Mitsuokella multacida TaxID=52226 RepID=A0A414NUV8_9FIRM|nr:hypothetical protein DW674_11020 [Mitsuokella multacida]